MNQTPLHYNIPQIRSMAVDAPFEYLVAGRGTGKTEGVIATKSKKRLDTMRRCVGVFQGATFAQLLTRTLPPVIKGWEKQGYKLGIHYLIGQKPVEKWKRLWKWPAPYQPPLKYEYFISWWNGSGIQLISQDRIGSSNGISIDWIMGDEAKLLNFERLKDELYPANRGIIQAFANDPHHHGITFTSDMPVGTGGRWLLEQSEQTDHARVKQILQIQAFLQRVKPGSQDYAGLQEMLRLLRKNLVYYHEASSLDNIDGLGITYFRQLMRDLDDFTLTTAILNRKPRRLEDGFYPDLDEERHGYFAYTYSKFENTGYDFEALSELGAEFDADYDPNASFHICIDNNRRLVPMPVVQLKGNEIRTINSFYSEYPEKLKDTVAKFTNYYHHHRRKVLFFWYDHTLVQEFGHTSQTAADEVTNLLRAAGWTVIERYIGQALGHSVRYRMWSHLLQEDEHYPFVFRVNRDRCKYLLESMYQTGAQRKKEGFGKDKSTEQDPKFPALEAPHFGEAADMLVSGILESGLSYNDADSGGYEMSFM